MTGRRAPPRADRPAELRAFLANPWPCPWDAAAAEVLIDRTVDGLGRLPTFPAIAELAAALPAVADAIRVGPDAVQAAYDARDLPAVARALWRWWEACRDAAQWAEAPFTRIRDGPAQTTGGRAPHPAA